MRVYLRQLNRIKREINMPKDYSLSDLPSIIVLWFGDTGKALSRLPAAFPASLHDRCVNIVDQTTLLRLFAGRICSLTRYSFSLSTETAFFFTSPLVSIFASGA